MTRRRTSIVTAAGHIPMLEALGEFDCLVDGFARELLKGGGRKRRTA